MNDNVVKFISAACMVSLFLVGFGAIHQSFALITAFFMLVGVVVQMKKS